MRILFTNPTPMIKYGMQPGFARNGWETDRLEVPQQSVEGLLEKIEEFRPDYLFTEGGVDTGRFVLPVLEEKKLPHIYWAVEDPIANTTLAMSWAGVSVLSLTPDLEMLPNYEKNGYKAICIPFAIDPEYYRTYPQDTHFSTLDAVHVGNNYEVHPNRRKAYQYIIQPFIDQGKKLEVYGFDWQHPDHSYHLPPEYDKGYLAHEQSVVAYSNAKITLGVHSITDSRTMQSMRTFEVLGCKGFFLTQRTRAIETMFQNHRHLVWSSCYEETVDLMKFYLNRDEEREKIAAAGQELVYREHTYEKRAAEILQALKRS